MLGANGWQKLSLAFGESIYEDCLIAVCAKETVLKLLFAVVLLLILTTSSVISHSQQWSFSFDGTLRRIRIPILMYHYVSELPPGADNLRVGLTVSPALFAAHLDALIAEGYTTITFPQLEAALQQGDGLPPRPVILTFDDGYDNHYTTVYPLLRQRGMFGTFYIATSFLDASRPGYITWDQAREMVVGGMMLDSHTKNHPSLASRDYNFLVYEILGSLESIEQNLKRDSFTFAYPIGAYDTLTLQVLAATSVHRAVTTQPGVYVTTDNRLEVPRVRIQNNTSVPGLLMLMQQR